MQEIFKDIPNYPKYQISNIGRVKSLKWGKERILKHHLNSSGYLGVRLCLNGKMKTIQVHQLVAIAFINHEPSGFRTVVDHIDNNPLNNRVDNLQLITQRENISKDKGGLVGASWSTRDKIWKSQIWINGKQLYLGIFNTEIEAYYQYEKALKNIHLFENPKQFRKLLIESKI